MSENAEKMKMLVVDDDVTVLSLLEEVFREDMSLDMETLSDSEEALRRLTSKHYDLLISDLMMPKVDGLQLVEKSIEANRDILVVIITGYASLETTLEAIHAGVYDYITKPFRIEEFRLLVYNAAARIRLMKENRHLRFQNAETAQVIKTYQNRLLDQEEEIMRLREELGRRQSLSAQTGGAGSDGSNNRANLSSYEKGSETGNERFERAFRNLESFFSEGKLTQEEFDQAKQRLRALV